MKINGIEFSEIEKEYLEDRGIFEENYSIRKFIQSLPLEDRRILILYAELNSLREAAKIYNCSHNMIRKRIVKIKAKIKPFLGA